MVIRPKQGVLKRGGGRKTNKKLGNNSKNVHPSNNSNNLEPETSIGPGLSQGPSMEACLSRNRPEQATSEKAGPQGSYLRKSGP